MVRIVLIIFGGIPAIQAIADFVSAHVKDPIGY